MADISSKSLSSISRKKKNIFIWISLSMIVIAFFFAAYSGIDMDAAVKARELRNKKLNNPDLNKDVNRSANTKISWAIDVENTIDSLEENQERVAREVAKQTQDEIIKANELLLKEIARSNKMFQTKLDGMSNANEALKKEIKSIKNNSARNMIDLNSKLSEAKRDMKDLMEDGVSLPPPPALKNKTNNSISDKFFKAINVGGEKVEKTVEKVLYDKSQTFEIVSLSNDFTDENITEPEGLTEEELKKLNTFEIVTGFTDAYLLTGAYVPLFGGGSSSGGSGGAPSNVPVLIETNGDLLMPNHTIGSIDKCFLLGVSTGNAGARAVEIRLDKLTCLLNGGKKVIQGEVDGYVVSETGSPGLPATMIYKAGDFIARMITAGVLEGLSSAVVNAASSMGNNSIGGTTSVYGGAMTGAGNGVDNAFSKLADFYLQLAESTLPILEVKPGRFISVVLVGGNTYELKDINLLDTRNIDSYIDEFVGE